MLSGRWRPRLIGLLLLNLAVTGVMAGRAVLDAPPPIGNDPAHYQAYRIDGGLGDLPLVSARRLGEVLILSVDERWTRFDPTERSAVLEFLQRQLVGRDGIRGIVVLDGGGRQLARVGRETMAMTEGMRPSSGR